MKAIEAFFEFDFDGECLTLRIPRKMQAIVQDFADRAKKNKMTQLIVRLGIPKRKATTGARSQLNRCWGEARHLAEQRRKQGEAGVTAQNIIDEVIYLYCVDRVKNGVRYPIYRKERNGKTVTVPASLSEIDFYQMDMLLEAMAQYADENGITLLEYDQYGSVHKTLGGVKV